MRNIADEWMNGFHPRQHAGERFRIGWRSEAATLQLPVAIDDHAPGSEQDDFRMIVQIGDLALQAVRQSDIVGVEPRDECPLRVRQPAVRDGDGSLTSLRNDGYPWIAGAVGGENLRSFVR